jgi:PPOX class probable F420-dependent enzyme
VSLDEPLTRFLDANRLAVFATTTEDGRPRQSLVFYARDGDRLLVTSLEGRGKTRDVARTGWASLAVRGDEPPFPSATLAGPARVLSEDVAGPTALVAQRVMGLEEPPDPQPETDLRAAGRVILAIEIERVGPVTYVE